MTCGVTRGTHTNIRAHKRTQTKESPYTQICTHIDSPQGDDLRYDRFHDSADWSIPPQDTAMVLHRGIQVAETTHQDPHISLGSTSNHFPHKVPMSWSVKNSDSLLVGEELGQTHLVCLALCDSHPSPERRGVSRTGYVSLCHDECRHLSLWAIAKTLLLSHTLRTLSRSSSLVSMHHAYTQLSRFFALASLSYFSMVLWSTIPVRYLDPPNR